ncbi:MAG: hypothetical protein ACUZ77_01730, partial [Candidatus Brocadiales bacterium]
MGKMRNLLKIAFLLLILCALVHTSFAQKGGTTNAVKPPSQEAPQKPPPPPGPNHEDILRETQRSIARSISTVLTLIKILFGAITLFIAIVGVFGFREVGNWKKTREEIDIKAKEVDVKIKEMNIKSVELDKKAKEFEDKIVEIEKDAKVVTELQNEIKEKAKLIAEDAKAAKEFRNKMEERMT